MVVKKYKTQELKKSSFLNYIDRMTRCIKRCMCNSVNNLDNAKAFFDASENGQGWVACKCYCAPNAAFRSQAGVFHPPLAPEPDLGGSLENYVEWMKTFATEVMPNCWVTHVVSVYDAKSSTALFSAAFHGKHTNTPEGATLPQPTNQYCHSDYVYRLHFNAEGKIDSLVKIWNSEWAAKEMGWMD